MALNLGAIEQVLQTIKFHGVPINIGFYWLIFFILHMDKPTIGFYCLELGMNCKTYVTRFICFIK